jgi:hypothetical protein
MRPLRLPSRYLKKVSWNCNLNISSIARINFCVGDSKVVPRQNVVHLQDE